MGGRAGSSAHAETAQDGMWGLGRTQGRSGDGGSGGSDRKDRLGAAVADIPDQDQLDVLVKAVAAPAASRPAPGGQTLTQQRRDHRLGEPRPVGPRAAKHSRRWPIGPLACKGRFASTDIRERARCVSVSDLQTRRLGPYPVRPTSRRESPRNYGQCGFRYSDEGATGIESGASLFWLFCF